MAEKTDVCAVILAGGSGTRLWPLSRLHSPKQFLALEGEDTLLEATIKRLGTQVARSDVLVVTSAETANGAGYAALKPYEKLLEPVARNTAPAIGLAALRYRMEGRDPVLIVLPSDHLIANVPAFREALDRAIEGASDGKLLTFGIRPTAPETGFGYIQALGDGPLREVAEFHEKPSLEKAREFIANGNYFWNSGMFVWRASAILDEIRQALPELGRLLDAIAAQAGTVAGLPAAVEARFRDAPSISIDHGVLQASRNIRMVPGDFGWSDVGSWDAVYDVAEKDARNNVIRGNVVAIDCDNTLLRSHDRLIAAVDVDNISVIETPDAVLVTRRGASQNVKKVVEELARRSGSEHLMHVTVRRPWGCYTILEEGPGFKIKRIEVDTGGKLSLQRHRHRSEHWVVVSGQATVTCDGRTSTLKQNESTFIPIGTMHRLENLSDEPLQMIEVQVGGYVGEDDIERFDDQYGRAKEALPTK